LIAQVKALLKKRQPPFQVVLKWNRNQPRGPKGTHTGGRWVKGVSAGAGGTNIGNWGIRSESPGMERNMGEARYVDILDAPHGEGFANQPRAIGMPRAEASLATAERRVSSPSSADVRNPTPELKELESGSVSDAKKFGGTSNTTFKVTMEDGTVAIYKPEIGENWGRRGGGGFANSDISDYVVNRKFPLAGREAFAFQVGDQLFGADNPVPETVLRENVEGVDIGQVSPDDDDDEVIWDDDELRAMYGEYEDEAREKVQDDAFERAGEQMAEKWNEDQQDHADNIGKRAEELAEIWNEEVENFPDTSPYGSDSMLREHPKLPMGSQVSFQRQVNAGVLDPIEVLDEAEVNVDGELTSDERAKVREIIREKLKEGYQELGEVDEDKAKDHLDRDDWMEEHQDTENQLIQSAMDSMVKSFDSWKQDNGYESGGGGGGGGPRNPEAPHPHGGSLQHWKTGHRNGRLSDEDGARAAVLDYALGTMDRHGNNILFDGHDRVIMIDNGYSMPASATPDGFTFRSELVQEWRSDGKITDEQRTNISVALEKTDWKALMDRHPGMNRSEREAFLGRINNLKEAMKTSEGLRTLWAQQSLMY